MKSPLAITDLADALSEEGIDVLDPNLGGTVEFDWGWVKLAPAWHTSTTPKGTVSTPAGLLISIGDTLVYHLGDTCLFGDLQLIARRTPVDVAIMPIGGHYTMDRTTPSQPSSSSTRPSCPNYTTNVPPARPTRRLKSDSSKTERLCRARAGRNTALTMRSS